jgi:hypothetical protein
MSFRRKILSSTGIISWGVLGFSRGLNLYDYRYKKYDIDYDKKTNYFYTTKITYGFLGLFLYINPFCIPIIVIKEIYRFEVNIRGLENEKDKDYYNEFI